MRLSSTTVTALSAAALLGSLLISPASASAPAAPADAGAACPSDGPLASTKLKRGDGKEFNFIVTLHYSASCKTVWTRLTMPAKEGDCGNASAGYACPTGTVTRNSDGASRSCTVKKGQTTCTTAQLPRNGGTAFASGEVDTPMGVIKGRTANK
jgi:hypothetical protein